MPLPSPSRAFWSSFVLILAAAGAAAAETPAPAAKAAPEAIDAWGNTVSVDEKVREQLAISVTAKMGSPEWVPVAFRILELNGEILPRLYWSSGLDIQCGKRYRKEHPETTREQYMAFGRTAEGQGWQKACIADQLGDPKADPRLADGMIASMEIGFMLPNLLQAVQQKRIQEGTEGTPLELTPAMEEKIPAMSREAFKTANCLIRKALEEVPIGKAIAEPALLQAPVVAAAKAGLCNVPRPAAPVR